jgi:hypothetical protein
VYQIVEFAKDPKHKPGATNPITAKLGTYKLLVSAEKAFYKFCAQGLPPGYGIRIDDMRYGSHREFYNAGNPRVYIKSMQRNHLGKFAFQSFSLNEYRRFVAEKADNPFSKVI